ncbi:NAD(P)-dependent alcohol dehydrogenase [Stenotrophomonas sp. 24(2023)]|uniref:zinc-dependent alcohol dehydrogenase family protein n=1 Tax=Stenotrophomonas sp. 24(2023) TaxID=3068324 RepID=UPI0027E0CAF7|nr:NAD(P)-dependent alcohol dehydrogenase [Stenotrophomonas sp. 24(2023)]WMJ68219.1 NAD(P)-dependent alcohol dehydrogenase [Stenotrophomonas sp. 24(2023)]
MWRDAWRTSAAGVLQPVREELPALGAHEVRVQVTAVSLNFRDRVVVNGGWGREPLIGRVPFTDAVGVVTEVGAAVTRFQPGARVCTTVLPRWLDGPLTEAGWEASPGSRRRDGVMASHLQWHEDELVLAPPHLDDHEASTLTIAALTAWHAVVELGALKAGDTVLVQTTGGVATFAIRFAAALGAKVIVVSRSAEKLALARLQGATATLDSTVTPEWQDEVRRLTEGRGAQLVLDMGLDDGLRRAIAATAVEGTIAIIGVVQVLTAPLDIFPVMNGNLRLRGVETGSRAMFERMTQFMVARNLHPVIERVYPASEWADALRALEQAPFGKIVLDLGTSAASS